MLGDHDGDRHVSVVLQHSVEVFTDTVALIIPKPMEGTMAWPPWWAARAAFKAKAIHFTNCWGKWWLGTPIQISLQKLLLV